MLDLDHWLEVFQSLGRHRLRTALTALGVCWGVFMLVVALGFGRGLEEAVLADFGNFAPNVVFVWGDRTSLPWAGRAPGRQVQLTLEDAELVRRRVPGLRLVLPRNHPGQRAFGDRVSRRGKSEIFSVWGELPEYVHLEDMIIDSGRFLNHADLAEGRKVAVIGSRVRETLFDDGEDPVGQSVRLGSADFTVVGVYASPEQGARGDWVSGRVFVPRTTAARLGATANKVEHLAMLVESERASSEIEAEVRAVLRARHGVAPDDPRGVGSFNREKAFGKIRGLFAAIAALTWLVGGLTLLAGAIGVSNIMMIAVAERSREIGIRKAIGATPATIIKQIVTEAVVLTGLAGIVGLVAGVAALEVAGRVVDAMPRAPGLNLFSRPEIDFGRALAAAALLTGAGALAGLAPARSAVALRPIEALAHE